MAVDYDMGFVLFFCDLEGNVVDHFGLRFFLGEVLAEMVLASSQFDIFWNLLLNETELTLQIRQIPMSQNKCIYIR